MRLGIFLWSCSPSCCEYFRNMSSNILGAIVRFEPTRVLLQRHIETLPEWLMSKSFAPTFSTV